MSGDGTASPPRPVWIRVAGIVERRHLGTPVDLQTMSTPASTILRIVSDETAADVVVRLSARGLDVLGIRPVT